MVEFREGKHEDIPRQRCNRREERRAGAGYRQMFGFWGGVDPATGNIIDQRHELYGQNIKGKVFVFPEGAVRP